MSSSDHLFFEGTTLPKHRKPKAALGAASAPNPTERFPHDAFYTWLFRQAGLGFERYRAKAMARRIGACLRAVGARDAQEAQKRIEAEPMLLRQAIDAILLGVTEFNRDPTVFETLAREILPRLRHRRRLRIWSAACSDGHELYSVAMLLADAGLLHRSDLLGTDCRPDAIERARAGLFSPESLSKLHPTIRQRHFVTTGPELAAAEPLRRAIRWKTADLFAGVQPGPWDLILWRNMAIYLTIDSAELIWRAMIDVLRPGGFLVIGKADHPPRELRLRRIAPCVVQKPEE